MNFQQTPPPPPSEYNYNIPPRPKTWLVESILATLFCCLPLGIIGIVNASRVNSLHDQTQYERARHASAKAKKWTLIALGVGILYLIIMIIMAVSSSSMINLPDIVVGEPLYFG